MKRKREFHRHPKETRLPKHISLGEPVKLLNDVVTEELCKEVFQSSRTNEREREWSLCALAEFWRKVVLRSPSSLEQAVEEETAIQKAMGDEPGEGIPETSMQALYGRCQSLPSKFFSNLHDRVAGRFYDLAPLSYNRDLSYLSERFPSIRVVDGSRLDRIARRLKVVQGRRQVVLPGAIAASYDPFRGVVTGLDFTPDAAEYELDRANRLFEKMAAGSLVIGDRLYAYPKKITELRKRGIFILTRPTNGVGLNVEKTLACRKARGVLLEDYLVKGVSRAKGQKGDQDEDNLLRWIIRTEKGEKREVVTSVLDPEVLSAEEAVELYARRWSVERVFFDLKRVLKLHKFYTANPNGVAMQVFAGAMVYSAMRVVQGRIAQAFKLAGEDLSPGRLFPRVASMSEIMAGFEVGVLVVKEANPGVKLVLPDPAKQEFCRVVLKYLLVRRRTGRRIKRRYCSSRAQWISLAHIPAARRAFCDEN